MKHTIFIKTKLFSPQSTEKVKKTTKKGKRYEICANNPFQKRQNKRNTNAIIKAIWESEERDVGLPCRIRFTRIGPRRLDFDNLVYSFKYIVDMVCSLITPGLAPGRADSNPNITIEYAQETGLYGIRIEVEG